MCLAELTLSCKNVHVQTFQGHVYSGRESLTVSPPPNHQFMPYNVMWTVGYGGMTVSLARPELGSR